MYWSLHLTYIFDPIPSGVLPFIDMGVNKLYCLVLDRSLRFLPKRGWAALLATVPPPLHQLSYGLLAPHQMGVLSGNCHTLAVQCNTYPFGNHWLVHCNTIANLHIDGCTKHIGFLPILQPIQCSVIYDTFRRPPLFSSSADRYVSIIEMLTCWPSWPSSC